MSLFTVLFVVVFTNPILPSCLWLCHNHLNKSPQGAAASCATATPSEDNRLTSSLLCSLAATTTVRVDELLHLPLHALQLSLQRCYHRGGAVLAAK